jgi:RNA polymerase sigma-70 factor (ECF subfamily)
MESYVVIDDSELRFQQIYGEYREKICRYLTRMVGDTEAEDLTQEVFVKVELALDAFRGESRLSTWVYKIATHAALDRLRASQNSRKKQLSLKEIAETEEDKDIWTDRKRSSTEQHVIHREMNGCIRGIIEALPDAYRYVIVLSELEGFKDSEISEIMGLSLRAVKIRLHRARAALKQELTKACVFYRDEQNEFACDRKDEKTEPIQIKRIK